MQRSSGEGLVNPLSSGTPRWPSEAPHRANDAEKLLHGRVRTHRQDETGEVKTGASRARDSLSFCWPVAQFKSGSLPASFKLGISGVTAVTKVDQRIQT